MFINLKNSDLETLCDPLIQDQASIFELLFENIKKCEEFLNKYLL